jgi:hypothetical protein
MLGTKKPEICSFRLLVCTQLIQYSGMKLFYLRILLQLFQRFLKQHRIIRFLLPVRNFCKKYILKPYKQFFQPNEHKTV